MKSLVGSHYRSIRQSSVLPPEDPFPFRPGPETNAALIDYPVINQNALILKIEAFFQLIIQTA